MSIVQKLTEGIVNRDLAAEGDALIRKWESTGLLEGLGDDTLRNGMARLLENQAKELLRESSTMSGGDVEGFAAVAFPLVRRVFGALIANDLVSVQPMSLPSGLIFFLDFTISQTVGDGGTALGRLGYPTGSSLYGGGVVGAQITGGVSLGKVGDGFSDAERGPYALNNGYSSPTGSVVMVNPGVPGVSPNGTGNSLVMIVTGTAGTDNNLTGNAAGEAGGKTFGANSATLGEMTGFDPDISGSLVIVTEIPIANFTADASAFNLQDLVAIQVSGTNGNTAGGLGGAFGGIFVSQSAINTNIRLQRRLTMYSSASLNGRIGDIDSDNLLMTWLVPSPCTLTGALAQLTGGVASIAGVDGWSWSYPMKDNFDAAQGGSANALGALVGAPNWGLENNPNIPEIDIKVDSVSVTAVTKKLKAKWTPELGQDLNAYHNLDAEVELTQILSEQVALEIDREIVEDLVRGSTAGVRYWSRLPGKFVNRETGLDASNAASPPDFTGNVSEWYETLIETINDVSAQIHRKTLRGAANFVVCGPEIANLLEFTAGFRANVSADSDRGDAGAVKVGSLSKKFDVIVDPYFPRNLVLVGRRGSSFLESGYVYAPYVPLQTTPTIFGVEDFVPRKGVMTRYAKKMVRPDMYGLVVVEDLV
jgi:hypothetical protein